nr:putative killer cell immunoglobulin-like receptor-like protein KIR3DX1 [Loxodonta africana]
MSKRNGTYVPELQNRLFNNNFTMSPVTTSAESNPVEIVVTVFFFLGVFTKRSISVHSSFLLNSGGNVTLHCCSELVFDKFILYKEKGSQYSQKLSKRLCTGHSQADSTMSPIMSAYGGTYGCYGSLSHSPYEWSAASDPLELMITGECGLSSTSSLPIHETSLLAPLGPMVMSGGNMTLCCSSESSFDMYHLSREGEVHEPCFPGVQSHNGASQADFSLRPVTPAYGGTFRCYRSFIQVVRTK